MPSCDEVAEEETRGAVQLERGYGRVAAGVGVQRLLAGREGAEQREARVPRDQLVIPLQQKFDRDGDLGRCLGEFNSLRPARYDRAHLNLPGLGDHFTPHAYQRDAVARIIAEPTVLLDHVVGAGKSGSMFMGAMELKRLGLAQQPWIVVPNHIIEQVAREAKQWYPAANVLVGAGATNAEGRPGCGQAFAGRPPAQSAASPSSLRAYLPTA